MYSRSVRPDSPAAESRASSGASRGTAVADDEEGAAATVVAGGCRFLLGTQPPPFPIFRRRVPIHLRVRRRNLHRTKEPTIQQHLPAPANPGSTEWIADLGQEHAGGLRIQECDLGNRADEETIPVNSAMSFLLLLLGKRLGGV